MLARKPALNNVTVVRLRFSQVSENSRKAYEEKLAPSVRLLKIFCALIASPRLGPPLQKEAETHADVRLSLCVSGRTSLHTSTRPRTQCQSQLSRPSIASSLLSIPVGHVAGDRVVLDLCAEGVEALEIHVAVDLRVYRPGLTCHRLEALERMRHRAIWR